MPQDAPNTALIVVDVLNPYEHEDADELVESMSDVVPNIAELISRARDEQRHVIYVNDNYGHWNSSSDKLLRAGLDGRHPELVEPLRPPEDASFVIKARHSIFYETPLEYLVRQEEIDRLVLVGQVTEQCILYSALDAHIRHIPIVVPRDAVAHIDAELAEAALRMMEANMEAAVVDADQIDFTADDAGTDDD